MKEKENEEHASANSEFYSEIKANRAGSGGLKSMKYRIRPMDGAFTAMLIVIALACFVPIRAHVWTRVLFAIAFLVILISLAYQVRRWVTSKTFRSSPTLGGERPLRRLLVILIVFPLGVLLMAEFLDVSARRTFLFERARAAVDSPALCQKIGCPIHIGWPIKVSISETSDSGTGTLEVPLSGAKGHAKLFAEGTKQNGVWSLNDEYFTVDGGLSFIQIMKPVGERSADGMTGKQ